MLAACPAELGAVGRHLRFKRGDIGEISAPLAVVQAVADNELVGDVEPDEIGVRTDRGSTASLGPTIQDLVDSVG